MKYYDHYILAQGGIHNITAFAVAFNFIFSPPPHLFLVISLLVTSMFFEVLYHHQMIFDAVYSIAYCSAVLSSGFQIPSIRDLTSGTP